MTIGDVKSGEVITILNTFFHPVDNLLLVQLDALSTSPVIPFSDDGDLPVDGSSLQWSGYIGGSSTQTTLEVVGYEDCKTQLNPGDADGLDEDSEFCAGDALGGVTSCDTVYGTLCMC